MKIEVYAVLKDYFEPSFSIAAEACSVSELKQQLLEKNPQAAGVLKASRFAVNNEFVQEDYKLSAHDIIAVLPPASGG
jgi:molybdopterin converting factor small subunit